MENKKLDELLRNVSLSNEDLDGFMILNDDQADDLYGGFKIVCISINPSCVNPNCG